MGQAAWSGIKGDAHSLTAQPDYRQAGSPVWMRIHCCTLCMKTGCCDTHSDPDKKATPQRRHTATALRAAAAALRSKLAYQQCFQRAGASYREASSSQFACTHCAAAFAVGSALAARKHWPICASYGFVLLLLNLGALGFTGALAALT